MINRIYFWPDGTEHTESYQDYLNSTITPVCRFLQRLIFIVKRNYFLIRHFNNIDISKSLNSRGDFEYVSKLTFPSDLIAKKIINAEPSSISSSRDIGFDNGSHVNVKSGTKGF